MAPSTFHSNPVHPPGIPLAGLPRHLYLSCLLCKIVFLRVSFAFTTHTWTYGQDGGNYVMWGVQARVCGCVHACVPVCVRVFANTSSILDKHKMISHLGDAERNTAW